jgi:hypothetical protein
LKRFYAEEQRGGHSFQPLVGLLTKPVNLAEQVELIRSCARFAGVHERCAAVFDPLNIGNQTSRHLAWLPRGPVASCVGTTGQANLDLTDQGNKRPIFLPSAGDNKLAQRSDYSPERSFQGSDGLQRATNLVQLTVYLGQVVQRVKADSTQGRN